MVRCAPYVQRMDFEQLSALDLAWLAKIYKVRAPDPCRVCGHELVIGRGGHRGTVYVCGSDEARYFGKDGAERRAAEEHVEASEQEIFSHGDAQVLALIAEVRARREQAGEEAFPPVGSMYSPLGGTPDRRYIGDDRFEIVLSDGRGVEEI